MFMRTYTKIKNSKYYNGANNLVVGKAKDETSGVHIKGFVGIKSKMHTFVTEGNHESKKEKGINKKGKQKALIKMLLMMN